MACLKMLLSGSLTFIITTTLITANSIPEYYPRQYDIKLKPYFNNNKFYGECNVTIDISSGTKEINLYAEKLCIIDINLIQPLKGFDKDDKKIKIIKSNYTYNNETHIISIYSTEVLLVTGIINMRYKGALHDNGGFKTFYRRRKNIAYERWLPVICFWNSRTQKIFPCWDDVRFSSKFKISIMHPDDYEILSNMPKQEEKADENGLMWTHFDTTPEIYIYLVAVVMAKKSIFRQLYSIDKELIENNITSYYNITLWGRATYFDHLWHAQDVMKTVALFINQKWKKLRNIWKMDHIAIPNYQDNDIINMGLIFYRESDIIYNRTENPFSHRIELTRLIGYKIAQEFPPHFQIYCSLSPWVQKALAMFMGAYAVDKALPEIRMMDLFVVQIQHEVLHWDGHLQSSTSHAAFSEVISYYKGSVILRMLQHAFTEEIFWKHVIREVILCVYDSALKTAYINRQKWDTLVSTQEKFDAIYSVEQLKSWLNHKHYPIIQVTRKYDQSLVRTEIVTIEAVNITKNLSIPLTYTTQIQLNFNNTSPTIWLKQVYQESYNNQSKYIEYIQMMKNRTSNQWIIFNLQQTGYYRVNYDKENWKLITRYLKSENYINIHVLNRAQIIDDAFHLMLAQQIEPLIFWDIVTYLEQETDYVAWYPMFKALEYMSSIFTLDNIDKNIFVKLQNILQSILNKIRHTELYYLAVEKHTKCLRQEAAKWSCLLGNNECLKEARNKLMLNFEHPKEYKILPWWKEWTYCYGLISIMDHYFDWTNMLFTWVKNSDHRISKFLTCIQNNDIIKAHLKDLRNMIMNSNSENHILRLALINDFLTMIAKHVKKDDIRNYMLNNYKEIIPGQMNTVATLTVIINHLYDDLHLTMLENFVLHDMNKEKIDLKRKKVHFAHSSKVWSDIHMEYEANTLKIQEKIKIRRIQIKKQHEFVQAFLQL